MDNMILEMDTDQNELTKNIHWQPQPDSVLYKVDCVKDDQREQRAGYFLWDKFYSYGRYR